MADFKIKSAAGTGNKTLIQSENQTDSNYAIQIGASGASTLHNATITTGSGLVGIKEQDAWRISTNLTTSSTTEVITANWERDDTAMGSQLLGTGMGTPSSGVFTFPSTGIWLIMSDAFIFAGTTGAYAGISIQCTTDDSNYNARAENFCNVENSGEHAGVCCMCFFDVTNVSTHKCRLVTIGATSGYQLAGASDLNKTGIIFLRIGDT